MKKVVIRSIAFIAAILLVSGICIPSGLAAEITDEAVLGVIAQLEAIDSLQEMQVKRSAYTATGHYDINTTSASVIASHEAAQNQYKTYADGMFAARIAAQRAYDALSDAQKAQIDDALAAKLSNELPTTFIDVTYSVTPRNDEYTFEAVKGDLGLAYEVSSHTVCGEIPQLFVLVDTADGKTSWSPNGQYVCGESNYELAYCCDVETSLEWGTDYKRTNLENSGYYGAVAAQHIRAILQNTYPFITLDEMRTNLKADGMDESFVDQLTRADIIAATQMAVWMYANTSDISDSNKGYFASINVQKNTGIYFTPLHDYTNEDWQWLPGKKQRTFDPQAEYRVNTLIYYLCNLEGVSPQEDQIIISDVEITRADLVPGSDDTYNVGMYIYLNNGGRAQDDLTVSATSYHTNADGTTTVTARNAQDVAGRTTVEMTVRANAGDLIEVVIEGTQRLTEGVYFYEPEGGRAVSQCLVGVAGGDTNVRAKKQFVFEEPVREKGCCIYKTANGTGLPLSDITFTIYSVVPDEGETLNVLPTPEEIEKYMIEENKVDSVITDETGYAALELSNGIYMVVEEYNADKIKEPIAPFYMTIPLEKTVELEDGTTSIEVENIVSVYPKNEPTNPPEEPPVVPPVPEKVTGTFDILKYDENDPSIVLEGVQFAVYRAATAEDTNVTIITSGGVQYAVVPVLIDGEPLILTTDENGRAVSPELNCGTYFLVEVEAPAGYNLLEEAVSVTVVSNVMAPSETVEIANQRGDILPKTGGTGTTLFLTAGGILFAGAVVLLVTKKRMSGYESDRS